MFKYFSYTFLTVLTVDLLATSGDITLTWSSPILPKLYSNDSSINPLGEPITEEEESWIGSLINIGAMIGPFPYGFLAEKIGRKYTLLCVAIPHIASYLTLAFSESVYLYYFARLLGGIAVGGGYTLLPMYIAEIAEDSNRGMLSSTLNIFWTFGNFIPYILGPYIPILWFNIILACVPGIFFVLFFIIGPETPYYFVKANKLDKAEESLKKLRSGVGKGSLEKEIFHIQNVLKNDEEGKFTDLFSTKTNLKALGISLYLIISQQLSGIDAVLFYTQSIFVAAGTDQMPADVSAIIVGAVLFLSSLITPFFADKWGRKILLLISSMGVVISHAAFGTFFYLNDSTTTNVSSISWLPLVSLIVYIITYNLGLGSIPWTVSSELFPSHVKSAAASLGSIACYTTSFLITRFYNDMTRGLGTGGTFWLFGGLTLLAFFFTLFFVPETKGKSFKEIQEILE